MREKRREAKAEKAALLDRSIQNELLGRLKLGTYGDIYNYPMKEYEQALDEVKAHSPYLPNCHAPRLPIQCFSSSDEQEERAAEEVVEEEEEQVKNILPTPNTSPYTPRHPLAPPGTPLRPPIPP